MNVKQRLYLRAPPGIFQEEHWMWEIYPANIRNDMKRFYTGINYSFEDKHIFSRYEKGKDYEKRY